LCQTLYLLLHILDCLLWLTFNMQQWHPFLHISCIILNLTTGTPQVHFAHLFLLIIVSSSGQHLTLSKPTPHLKMRFPHVFSKKSSINSFLPHLTSLDNHMVLDCCNLHSFAILKEFQQLFACQLPLYCLLPSLLMPSALAQDSVSATGLMGYICGTYTTIQSGMAVTRELPFCPSLQIRKKFLLNNLLIIH
jgi:hypothetical protein